MAILDGGINVVEKELIAVAAARILQQPRQHSSSAQSFRFTPSTGVVEELQEKARPPFATVTGGEQDLKALLRNFEGWEGELKIGVLREEEGLLDFWLY